MDQYKYGLIDQQIARLKRDRSVGKSENLFSNYSDRLDIAIAKADREVLLERSTEQRLSDLQFNCIHGEIHPETEQFLSELCESMLPHKQILRDRLGDLDVQARMETYGH